MSEQRKPKMLTGNESPAEMHLTTLNNLTIIQGQYIGQLKAEKADLYEALKEARAELEGCSTQFIGESYNNPQIDAALAKAEGKGP